MPSPSPSRSRSKLPGQKAAVAAAAVALLVALPGVLAVGPLVDLGYTQVLGMELAAAGVTQWLGVRYAAPPLGDLRFAAPIDPPQTYGVQNATAFKPICLPRSKSDFTMKPNKRFTVDEDCLYLNIFAPTWASPEPGRRVPVMHFIQGGGFGSNSNANFNGTQLAAFGDIVVVQINYRVGPFGFAQSKEIAAGGALNNGIRDMIQSLKWVKANIAQFGGDPDNIVVQGDSAGATGISILLAAWADEDPGLIKGAILESPSVATLRTMEQGQDMYDCLVREAGCTNATDTLACLRAQPASALQTEPCQFNPHLDGDLIPRPVLAAFDAGRFLRVPTLIGTCDDEGSKNVPMSTNTTAEADVYVQSQAFNTLSADAIALINKYFIDVPQPVFPNAGVKWRQTALAHGQFRADCMAARMLNGLARAAGAAAPTYNYRYAVRDAAQDAAGFGAYHTVELNGVFGPTNTDGAPPASYRVGGANAAIVNVTMAYWAAFVRERDPGCGFAAGGAAAAQLPPLPRWTPWTGKDGRERLRFVTGDVAMEAMNATQRDLCVMLDPMLEAIETILSSGKQINLNQPGDVNGTSWAL